MLLQKDLYDTKKHIKRNIGSKVKLEFNKGRQKFYVGNGVISNVYPSIFTVQLFDGEDPSRKLSFSYVDILTKSVNLTLCE
ncbi:MAG: Veg family protein [Clostridiales bacterium]|nr:Veg family protein [Clostridiales bacterium]